MTVSIEILAEAHLRSPALRFLLKGIPPPFLLELEAGGGQARAVLCNGETVGFLSVTPEREAMIAIHPDHQSFSPIPDDSGRGRFAAGRRARRLPARWFPRN